MITDLDKYRAQNLQIGGFCLMTPFGKLILDVPIYKLSGMNLFLLLYGVVAFILFILGIIVMFRGEVHLEKGKQQWTQK